jgi:hypothetical protein
MRRVRVAGRAQRFQARVLDAAGRVGPRIVALGILRQTAIHAGRGVRVVIDTGLIVDVRVAAVAVDLARASMPALSTAITTCGSTVRLMSIGLKTIEFAGTVI